MSINMSIKDNGVATTMTVDKLKIPSPSAGSENWTPIDGAPGRLVKVTTGQNGIIESEGLNAYGISEITVNQSGSDPTSSTDSAQYEIPLEKHTTTISVGGVKRYMTAKKVRVNLAGGGTCDLRNVSDDGLKTLTIQRKGTYKAREYNAYGFSRIDVSLPSGGESGKENGWDEAFDGKGLPAYIRITQNPTKMDYTDGETMDYTGIVVHAYNNDGIDMGAIPFNELVLPVTVAEYDKSTPAQYESDLDTGVFTQPIPCAHYVKFTDSNGATMEFSGPVMTCIRIDGKFKLFGASDSSPIAYYLKVTDHLGNVFGLDVSKSGYIYTANLMDVYYFLDDTYKYWFISVADAVSLDGPVIDMQSEPTNAEKGAAMWTLVYGQMVVNPVQTIPVQWSRPGDGKVLGTTFEILVASPYSTGND